MNLERLIAFYNSFTPDSVARFPEFYSADAYFKDPFNEVRGMPAIQRIFSHMFEQVGEPRFVVVDQVADAGGAMLIWEFYFRVRLWGKGEAQVMRGVSHLRFDAEGNERPEFILNQAPYRQAKVLVADANYGCGSSREAAVYVMYDYGIRSVIAPSFGDIHYGNALQNGFLPIVPDFRRMTAARQRPSDVAGKIGLVFDYKDVHGREIRGCAEAI